MIHLGSKVYVKSLGVKGIVIANAFSSLDDPKYAVIADTGQSLGVISESDIHILVAGSSELVAFGRGDRVVLKNESPISHVGTITIIHFSPFSSHSYAVKWDKDYGLTRENGWDLALFERALNTPHEFNTGMKVFFRRDDHIVPLGIVTKIVWGEKSYQHINYADDYTIEVTWQNGVVAVHKKNEIGSAQAMIDALSKEVYLPG